MGAQLRAVRARIRAVKSIAKITRAQELIASSRIVRAQQRMRAAEPYSRELTTAVEAVVSRSSALNHPLLSEPESSTRAAVLVLTSDGGFCGAYNANVLREASRLRQRNTEDGIRSLNYVAGRKGIAWHRFRELPVEEEWSGFSAQPSYAEAERVATVLLDAFEKDVADGGVEFVDLLVREVLDQRPPDPPRFLVGRHLAEPLPGLAHLDAAEAEVADPLLPDHVEHRLEPATADVAQQALADLQNVGVVRAGQSAVRGEHEHAGLRGVLAVLEQRVLDGARLTRQVLHRLRELDRVGPRGFDALLGADDPRRRDQLHRPGDLLRRLDRSDPSTDDAELGSH